jgi:lipid A 4'-phosphatase
MTDPLRAAVVLTIVTLAAFVVFAVWPGIDIAVSAAFYDPSAGAWSATSPAAEAVRMTMWRLSQVVALTALGALILSAWRRRAVLHIPLRDWALIVLLYVLVPGLLTDTLLKRFWGRARPVKITEFDGTLTFTAPHEISDQCLRNCSFVSGEVTGTTATAVALTIILLHWRDALPRAWFGPLGLVIWTLPLLVGVQRVASGGHFLSDAIFSVLFVLLAASVLRLVLTGRRSAGG